MLEITYSETIYEWFKIFWKRHGKEYADVEACARAFLSRERRNMEDALVHQLYIKGVIDDEQI